MPSRAPWRALAHSPTLVYVVLGMAANLLFAWHTSVGFGVTRVLRSLGSLGGALVPTARGRLGQIGDSRAVAPLVKALKGRAALVALYQSGRLDEEHKRLVLMERPTITKAHADHHDHTDKTAVMDCFHTDTGGHGDSGTGVSFPV